MHINIVNNNINTIAPHSNSANYVNTWKNAYAGEDRIMFFFEKNNDGYVFKNFVVTQKIRR